MKKIVFSCRKLALFNDVIALPVSDVVSMEVNRLTFGLFLIITGIKRERQRNCLLWLQKKKKKHKCPE